MMLLAMIFITIGHSKCKKADDHKTKFKHAAIFYTIAVILVIASIPWPFLRPDLGGQYF